jgi:hypothetical protein
MEKELFASIQLCFSRLRRAWNWAGGWGSGLSPNMRTSYAIEDVVCLPSRAETTFHDYWNNGRLQVIAVVVVVRERNHREMDWCMD